MQDREQRTISRGVEVRADDGAPKTLIGYAAIFGAETEIAGLFREVIKPGAFTAAVGRDDCRCLFNHDPNFVIGRTTSGTLTLSEDETGLRYTVTPPNTTWANDLMVSVARGDISQSSFAFRVTEEKWIDSGKRDVLPLREILSVDLFDVSPVAYPAYESTTVSARAQAAAALHVPVVPFDADRRRMGIRRRELALRGF